MPVAPTKSLDEKLARLAASPGRVGDFILADAKDADMAFGLTAPGPRRTAPGFKSLEDYREQIREIVGQALVDLMLLSASNLEQLAIIEKRFAHSPVTPAARANDTTDIWNVRGGKYGQRPSRPFRTATLAQIMFGTEKATPNSPVIGADLGLYSVTFNNEIEADHATLLAYRDFRLEAERHHFRHFLEVFSPNLEIGLSREALSRFMNDHVTRLLAGIVRSNRPIFLKIPYLGAAALEELVGYDPSVVVGILGGAAGTTGDAFQLLAEARKHGARVALFGRKINLSDHPLTFVKYLRAIADGAIEPKEAVNAYHGDLQRLGILPSRSLTEDFELTDPALVTR